MDAEEGLRVAMTTTAVCLMAQIRPKPAFTLVSIAPQRLEEKKAVRDHFFQTVLTEGVLLATEN